MVFYSLSPGKSKDLTKFLLAMKTGFTEIVAIHSIKMFIQVKMLKIILFEEVLLVKVCEMTLICMLHTTDLTMRASYKSLIQSLKTYLEGKIQSNLFLKIYR